MDTTTVEEPINKTTLTVAILVSLYFFYYLSSSHEWHFIDNVNLIIHEAGHVVFSVFGRFMNILGGSLLQVVFPSIFVGYFYVHRDFFSASLVLFWVGQNFINVSVYAGDAIVMQLPLLGGDSVLHDWNTLLSMMNILKYTPHISSGLYFIGSICVCVACGASIICSQPQWLRSLKSEVLHQ